MGDETTEVNDHVKILQSVRKKKQQLGNDQWQKKRSETTSPAAASVDGEVLQ